MNNKLKQMILYILNKCGPMESRKLECLLYFIDFDFYEKHERPFFKNVEWVKGENHPELRKNNDEE